MSLQDPRAAAAPKMRCAVQSLQKLCLKAIGRRLKHFCNLRLHPAVAQTLSGPEKQLIDAYDLSRLDVFEAQDFLQTIDKWLVKMESNKWRHQHRLLTPRTVDQAMKSFLRYVLLPLTENQSDQPYSELAIDMGLEAPPMMQLRKSTPSVKLRKKWVSREEDNPEGTGDDQDSAASLMRVAEKIEQDEVVCYRLPVASVGCGIIAGTLQHSSSLVKLRLNNCQITDAGVILLASGIRLTTTLHRLDLSNEEFAYPEKESMRNEIGNNGAQAIALALEHKQSVKEVDLSGNPVGSGGAMALASMLRKNGSLQRLHLDRSLVWDCAETLIEVFQTSKSLNHLSMLWCGLRPGVGTKLASVQATKTARQISSSSIDSGVQGP